MTIWTCDCGFTTCKWIEIHDHQNKNPLHGVKYEKEPEGELANENA